MAGQLSQAAEELWRIGLNPKVAARERISALYKIMTLTMGNPPSHLEVTGEGGGPIRHAITPWEPSKEYLGESVDGEVVEPDG